MRNRHCGVALQRKLSYHRWRKEKDWRRTLAWRCAETIERREKAIFSPLIGEGGETETAMQVLIITFALLASIWIIVLWGSRYFGPR